jgi:hypothetical protein
MKMCECEHADHFPEAIDKCAYSHRYQEVPAQTKVETDFGTFAVCWSCAKFHMPRKEVR